MARARREIGAVEWLINFEGLFEGRSKEFTSKEQKEAWKHIQKISIPSDVGFQRYMRRFQRYYYENYFSGVSNDILEKELIEIAPEEYKLLKELNLYSEHFSKKTWSRIDNKIKKRRLSEKNFDLIAEKQLLINVAKGCGIELKHDDSNRNASQALNLVLNKMFIK